MDENKYKLIDVNLLLSKIIFNFSYWNEHPLKLN